MSFLELLVCASGITFALQHKIPFIHNKISFLDKMLKCTFCTGFHAGWIAYLALMFDMFVPREAVLFSFASAIFSYATDEAIKFLEEASYGDND